MTIHELVTIQRQAYTGNPPLTVENRIGILEILYQTICRYENSIYEALYQDLCKNKSESYMTEVGLVLNEISNTVKHLHQWADPKRVRTPLTLFPARSYLYPEPYGVVLIMSPWNYPFQLTMIPLIGALAAGNHCILKPSSYSPNTSGIISRIISECFSVDRAAVILGGRDANRALLDERFDYIFFTGGARVGRIVAARAAETLTPITLELGGKSPCIVDESANIAIASRRIAFGKAVNAGQTCVAPDYLLVHESVRDELLEGIRANWSRFYTQDALSSNQWPRMVNQQHYDRIMNLIQGENIYCGGYGDCTRIAPTILSPVSWNAPIMQEEIFGPVLPVIPFSDIEEVICAVNQREHPLALYLFTASASVRENVLTRIPFGGGCVNDTLVHLTSDRLPFGGVGASGMGRYHGKYSFDTFSHIKSILVKSNTLDIETRYPPYTQEKYNLIKKLLK